MNEKTEFQEVWFRGLSDKDRKEAINTLRFNPVLRTLSELIEGFMKEAEKSSFDYDSASWAFKQAHNNGLTEAYKKIHKLLNPSNLTKE